MDVRDWWWPVVIEPCVSENRGHQPLRATHTQMRIRQNESSSFDEPLPFDEPANCWSKIQL